MSIKTVTVSKFLGLNQSPNGSTGLALGEASAAENFYITDDYKLKSRPGTVILNQYQSGGSFRAFWNGLLGDSRWTLIFYQDGHDFTLTMTAKARNAAAASACEGDYALDLSYLYPIKVFPFGDAVWVMGTSAAGDHSASIYCIAPSEDGGFVLTHPSEGYCPLAVTGASPMGGGGTLERLNLLSSHFRAQYSADGSSKEYQLPPIVYGVELATVDGQAATGAYDAANHSYVFEEAPVKGVNNVEFTCFLRDADHAAGLEKLLSMRHCEAYNGSTDTRLFFYGDGTNVCYYSGVPTYGQGLYVPAGNELAVDSSASAITGMRRHYTRLMAYKADGAFSISYDTVTLADGTVTAGFYVRPASRDVGNDMDNQIQTVGNYPRTLCGGSLFEWRHTASYYQDERYAKRIGQQVSLLLREADPTKIVTCDDDASRTYYMFLNDSKGTVLVNRYELDAWTVYTGEVFRGIRYADGFHGDLLFANDNTVYRFDPDSAFDAVAIGSDPQPIRCRWESGFLSFGADYLRKYSATLWISMLPEPCSNMEITVKTDRRDEYMVKSAGRPLLGFNAVDFSNFSFLISRAPKIQRVKLKVKKFVYYKLIFEVNQPGTRATVLGYDQQIRYASHVK